MKRGAVVLFLVLASSALAASLYSWWRTPASAEECTFAWLAEELALTEAQQARVWDLHVRRCEEIGRLAAACAGPGADSAVLACGRMTERLVAEVCAELTPEQRAKYLELVAPCLAGVSQPPAP